MSSAPLRGRLIAIDGPDGQDMYRAASSLIESLADRGLSAGISRWDASGLFTDVVAAPAIERDVSPRTLVLLYAADLAFRLRWQIAPALDQGYVVVAAPYLATVSAFGTAAGLSRDWISTVLRFAPVPTRAVILKDQRHERQWKRRPERGFAECCTSLLEATPEGFRRRKTRDAMVSALTTEAETSGGLVRRKDLGFVADQIVNRPRAATSRRHVRTDRGSAR